MCRKRTAVGPKGNKLYGRGIATGGHRASQTSRGKGRKQGQAPTVRSGRENRHPCAFLAKEQTTESHRKLVAATKSPDPTLGMG